MSAARTTRARRTQARPLVAALCCLCSLALATEIPLYATGPSQDAAFVRFVNAQETALEISASGSKARTRLEVAQPASPFYSVNANAKLRGRLQAGDQKGDIALAVKPGEFATVVAMPGAGTIRQTILREQPDDFNALKVSLALYNVDPQCGAAGLHVVGRNTTLFEGVGAGTLQRRAMNPVSISVQLRCNGQPAAATLALGALQAGQRYSVFVVPAAGSPRLFLAADSVSR